MFFSSCPFVTKGGTQNGKRRSTFMKKPLDWGRHRWRPLAEPPARSGVAQTQSSRFGWFWRRQLHRAGGLHTKKGVHGQGTVIGRGLEWFGTRVEDFFVPLFSDVETTQCEEEDRTVRQRDRQESYPPPDLKEKCEKRQDQHRLKQRVRMYHDKAVLWFEEKALCLWVKISKKKTLHKH